MPSLLKPGDEIRVLALSRSLGGALRSGFTEADVQFATERLQKLGLKVTFGRHVRECNDYLTAALEQRLEDLHEAIADSNVKAILAVSGGIGAIQLLPGIDYELIAKSPKIICGYSDIGYLCNAIYARSGVITYYGPNFTSFTMRQGADYTLQNFYQCLFHNEPIDHQPAETWSDDPWHKDQTNRTFHPNDGLWTINPGKTEGTILGGNIFCLNMLQGTPYFPPLRDAVLFLEHVSEGKATLMSLDSGLRALTMQPGSRDIRAIVLGRYSTNANITRQALTSLARNIPALSAIPIIANADFGHTTPVTTIPIGGRCNLRAHSQSAAITFARR